MKYYLLITILLMGNISIAQQLDCHKEIKVKKDGTAIRKSDKSFFSGSCIAYFKNSEAINCKLTYKNGRLNDTIYCYYPTGELYEKRLFVDGQLIEWSSYFKTQIPAHLVHFKNGLMDGTEKKFYEDGKLEWVANYKEHKRHGMNIEYYSSGQIRCMYNYNNGVQDGETISYYENGQVERHITFVNGKIVGDNMEYYENGQVKSVTPYKNGLWHGTLMSYYQNGKVRSEEERFEGELNGVSRFYDENGNVITENHFKNGIAQD